LLRKANYQGLQNQAGDEQKDKKNELYQRIEGEFKWQ
jgi:hypothetical protein